MTSYKIADSLTVERPGSSAGELPVKVQSALVKT
jgi:hypothetical protein